MPIFVNTVEITDDQVHQEMQYHPAKNVDLAREMAAQSLVISELLIQEAVNLKICKKSEIKNLSSEKRSSILDKLFLKVINVPDADHKTCYKYYIDHQKSFNDKKNGKIIEFKLVEDLIKNYLRDKSSRIAVSLYIEKLARSAKISGFKMIKTE